MYIINKDSNKLVKIEKRNLSLLDWMKGIIYKNG